MKRLLLFVLAAAAGCSQTSGNVPSALRGTWGYDCATPELRFDSRGYYDERRHRSYEVQQVVRRGDEYDVQWHNPDVSRDVVDTYNAAGGGLRIVKTTVAGQLVAEFRRKPWKRCE
jgi:hypothetical protein